MISIYRRGRVWWARGSVGRVRVKPQSLDTRFREVAAKRAGQMEIELGRNALAPLDWPTFERQFLSWIDGRVKARTKQKYEFVVSRFATFLRLNGTFSPSEVSAPDIARYAAWRANDQHPTRRSPVGHEGIKSDLRILKRVFSYAVEQGCVGLNPVRERNLNSRAAGTQPFSRDEVRRMLEACSARDRRGSPVDLRPVVLFFLATGLRISDVIHFPRSALDAKTGQIIYRTTKRGKVVSLPLTGDALESVKGLPQRGPGLFSTASGKPILSLDAYLSRLWEQAGIEHAHAHRFRDTFAVRLLEAGATLYDVAKLLGISTQVAERHYAPYVRELQERGRRLVESVQLEYNGL